MIVASRDWHPEGENHCVRNTDGAKFHPELNIDTSITIITKGEFDLSEKHYSAFNGENINLNDLLKQNLVDEVYIGGLAADYCVKKYSFGCS